MTALYTILTRHSQVFLISIILFSLFLRLYRLSQPPIYIFDEVYHAFTAKAYADNDPRGYEWWNPSPEKGTAYEWLHPPVSKLIMATSIKIFGKTTFAWRLGSAIFGTLTIYLVYLLTLSLFNRQFIALLATFLASLDGLLLVQSRIAMNDIYVTGFILAALIFYWRFWLHPNFRLNLILSGLFTGLAISTKWSGIFLLGIIGIMEIYWFIAHKRHIYTRRIFLLLISYLLLPITIYLLSYTQFFLQNHTWKQFMDLHRQIIAYETGLKATHPYQSPAWQWPLLIRPVWYHVDYKPSTIANIYNLSNPLISWFGLIALTWTIYSILSQKQKKSTPSYLLLTTSYILVWCPWLFSPRIMFYYHYTPAIPFLTISLALFLNHLYRTYSSGKFIFTATITLISLSFLFFLPIWLGIPVSSSQISFFFWLPTWK